MDATVLVVDDEPDLSALVAYHLARESYRVRTAADGLEALRAVEADPPDLIVLDLMLPGFGGLDLLRELRGRRETEGIPVILLTARKEEEIKIEGFRLGADDYVAKPFSPQELVFRVGAVLRRVRQSPPTEGTSKILRVGPFVLDHGAARVRAGDREVSLTRIEFDLLQTLMERRGRVQTRRQLLEAVWDVRVSITTRTVDMHIQRLRTKLGPEGEWIETVRGFGYRFRSG